MIQLDLFASRAPAVDRPRLSKQCQQIVDLLRKRPATNIELAALALKYSGRLSEIRQAGFNVVAKRIDGGLWQYRLLQNSQENRQESTDSY